MKQFTKQMIKEIRKRSEKRNERTAILTKPPSRNQTYRHMYAKKLIKWILILRAIPSFIRKYTVQQFFYMF